MKKLLLTLTMLLMAEMALALPFQTTPSPTTYPISWYKLKTNGCYVGASLMYNELTTTTSNPSSDEYLWCFVQLSSGKTLIYNKSKQSYLYNGWCFTYDETSAAINFVEAGSGNNFYICSIFNGNKMYLDCETYGCSLQYTPLNFTAILALTEDKTDSGETIVFSDLEVHDTYCSFYFDTDTHLYSCLRTLYVNGQQVEMPYVIQRTDEDQTVEAEAHVVYIGPYIELVATRTYVIPALGNTGPDPGPDPITPTLTPTTAYTPNNVQTDPAEDYYKLFDKDRSTKWCVDNSTGSWETIWVDFKSNVAFVPTGYTMTTGNDTQSWKGRNPKKWKIYAKAKESDEWTTIVDVSDGAAAGLGTANTTDYSFNIDGINTEYQYFRFEVSEVCGKGGWQNNHYVFQLAELALIGQPARIPGDVNGDGKVNVSDVTALVNMILGVVEKNEQTADVNGDGKINVSDVTALVNIILGVI